jgi:hypothetical protein
VKAAREGRSLSPGKALGKKPLLDEKAKRILEADVQERPFAKLADKREYLRKVAGVSVSESTLSRVPRKMGFGRKKDAGCERAIRVPEGVRSGDGDLLDRVGSLGVRGLMLEQHFAGAPLRMGQERRAGAPERSSQLGQERNPPL